MTHIYVIGASENLKKIGITRNPPGRLRNLQTANPAKLQLEYLKQCEEHEAVRLEREVHKRFSADRLAGEWFAINAETAVVGIESVAVELGVPLLAAAPLVNEQGRTANKSHFGMATSSALISGVQCRIARAGLDWSIRQVADKTEIHHNTIGRIERGAEATPTTLRTLQKLFEAHGFRFSENGVCPPAGL